MSDVRLTKAYGRVKFTALSVDAKIVFVREFDHLMLVHTVPEELSAEMRQFFLSKGLTIEGE